EQRSSVRLNGKPTVTLEVRRQSGANTVAVIAGVKQALGRVASQIPPDVKLQLLEDQSGFIYAALHEINIHLIVGSILASLVVIFIPVSFMSSIAGRFLYQFGITAAAAVLVSLLISFTLTPMMCARMLRVSGAEGGHDGARSRRGFYRWIDAGYMASLKFS